MTLGPQERGCHPHSSSGSSTACRATRTSSSIEEDAVREPFAFANTTAGGETVPYGIQMVQANLVSSTNAAARKICIIDSGYSQQHEDLSDDVTAKQTDSGSGTWNKDSCGHGTHVAGTIAAIGGNGVGVVGANPGVALHIVKVFGNDNLNGGACGWTYSSNLVSALNECTANGANVVSMSLGGGLKSRTEENAFAAAYANNVLSVAAAGNGGNTKVSYPAGYASVVSVAALDAAETLAPFSQRNSDVELAAPGVSVLSTVPYKDVNTLTADLVTWGGWPHRRRAADLGHARQPRRRRPLRGGRRLDRPRRAVRTRRRLVR